MDGITFLEREMTAVELHRMKAGFAEHAAEFGNPGEASERYGFVVLAGKNFIGCASGLTDENGKWFYLSDLFIEKAYRGQGLGATVLAKLEQRIAKIGIQNIWTWTAGYEAPAFYQKQGYEIFAELEDWYLSGHSRVGLRKKLAA